MLTVLWLAFALHAATIKLYLKDGSHHVVREYKAGGDRVRFYSLERSDWEEIPRDLVDFKRTEAELTEREQSRSAERKAIAEEEAAEREHLATIASIPEAAGVYWQSGKEMKPLVLAESKLVTDKKRSILKVMSPLPIFTGKATVEIDGEKSARIMTGVRPEFFIRLSADENFIIARLAPGKKASRIVEKITIDPVMKDMKYEESDEVEIFRQQLGDRLFKIWPTADLKPGEYAVIQFTPGKVNPQVWDFSLKAE